jgi:hypothetical protein
MAGELVHDRQVEPSQDQLRLGLDGLPLDDFDVERRVLDGERGQRRRQEAHARRLEGAHAHQPAHLAGRRLEIGLGAVQLLRQHLGVPHERVRGLGQADAAADPLEELDAHLLLEAGELLGDGRRRVVERVGDRSDRAPMLELAQEPEAIRVEDHSCQLKRLRKESSLMLDGSAGRVRA